MPAVFASRSFGLETVAVSIPSTPSLSQQTVDYRLDTLLHEADTHKGFPYGPRLSFRVRYNKDGCTIALAFAALALSQRASWAFFRCYMGTIAGPTASVWTKRAVERSRRCSSR
jgi:hypothetical protein